MSCFSCIGSSSRGGKKNGGKKNGGEEGGSSSQPNPVAQPNARIFRYGELATITNGFNRTNSIGVGGFGRVYKGQLSTGQIVAVKRLNRTGNQGNQEFLVEVLMLSLLHHPNLVSMVGYCAEGEERLLVYEYMPMGSLEDRLQGRGECLDWNTRMKIAAGAARGLEYLHDIADPPVIYRDLKASNILLDDGFFPKLSDFGLSKLGPVGDKTHVSTRLMGTVGYCAPEYALTFHLTKRCDIFSFGVVLLEIITGRKAYDETRTEREKALVAWARPLFKDRTKFKDMVDPRLGDRYPSRGLYQALAVAAMCMQQQAAARPVIGDVVAALSYLESKTYDPDAQDPMPNRPEGGSQPGSSSAQTNAPDLTTSEQRMNRDLERQRSIADAKKWGESVRGKKRTHDGGDVV